MSFINLVYFFLQPNMFNKYAALGFTFLILIFKIKKKIYTYFNKLQTSIITQMFEENTTTNKLIFIFTNLTLIFGMTFILIVYLLSWWLHIVQTKWECKIEWFLFFLLACFLYLSNQKQLKIKIFILIKHKIKIIIIFK